MRTGKQVSEIFACHIESYIMKPSFSYFYINRDCGSRQLSVTETLLSFAGICKNCTYLTVFGNAHWKKKRIECKIDNKQNIILTSNIEKS